MDKIPVMVASASNRLPVKQAILWITLSTLLVSGSVGAGLFYYHWLGQKRRTSSAYQIARIVNEGSLPTLYLEQLLGLAADQPVSLFGFDLDSGKEALLLSPVISSAQIRRIPPDGLRINYCSPVPLARLADEENTGVDASGQLFPLRPFYRELPDVRIAIGLKESGIHPWEGGYDRGLTLLALEVLSECKKHGLEVGFVDVTCNSASSAGRQEIVVRLSRNILLRLPVHAWQEALVRYCLLEEEFLEERKVLAERKVRVVDLRLDHLALVADE